jgi:hypothetical protein
MEEAYEQRLESKTTICSLILVISQIYRKRSSLGFFAEPRLILTKAKLTVPNCTQIFEPPQEKLFSPPADCINYHTCHLIIGMVDG